MMAKPRIGIVGAGAVGSLIVAALASGGHNAYWVVRSAQRRKHVAELVLVRGDKRREVDTGRMTICVTCSELPSDLTWIIIAVKAQHVMGVLAELPSAHDTHVMVVANGLHEHGAHVGLLYGGAYVGGSELHATPVSRLALGRLAGDGADTSPGLIPMLSAPWLSVEHDAQIAVQMWHKLALNCVINPLTALLDCPNGELLLGDKAPLVRAVLAEVCAVANAELRTAWTYSPDDLLAAVRDLTRETAANSSSMREDLRRGRETEITRLNVAVAALGRRYGQACPANELVGHMVSLISNKSSL